MESVVEKTAARRAVLGLIGAGALALLLSDARAAVRSRAIKVYKSPYCGCCGAWTKILVQAGYEPEVFKTNDLAPVKRRAGVPANLESCHTAFIDGYVVEGHVPVEAIKKMLAERPKIVGIGVPDMPVGSPGMPGPDPEPFSVIAFAADGRQTVYMRFR
jgi:hypothetical protein